MRRVVCKVGLQASGGGKKGDIRLRKFVSMRTVYGGTRAVLYWKKSEEET